MYSISGGGPFRTEKQARAEAYKYVNNNAMVICRVFRNYTSQDGIQVGVAFKKVKADKFKDTPFVIADDSDFYIAYAIGPFATIPFTNKYTTYVLKKDGSLGKRA